MSVAIETSGLVKHFGDTHAVDGIDLKIRRGSIYGLLGPNGAGKTTTIRMLATLLRPSGGTATVLGFDVVRDAAKVRARVSLTGQFASVDEDLTGRENLILVGRLLGLSWRQAGRRTGELLEAFSLTEAATRQVRTFSGGMRRRLDIAASLVVTPEVLFLDEPTTGLDPRSRSQVWEIVRAVASEGTTVLLTTQYLDEADRLAERLAVIDHGRCIAEGTSNELKALVGANTLQIRLRDAAQHAALQTSLKQRFGHDTHHATDARSLSLTVASEAEAATVLSTLAEGGIGIAEFSLGSPSLDEVFLALTGRPPAEQTTEQTTEVTP